MTGAAHPTLIVGGGIGGLTTALALAARGRPVHVLEKAAAFGEIGAGLQLAPNAMHVLDRLGLLPEIAKHAVYPSRLVWMDALAGEPITAVDLGAAFRARYGQPYIVMHRSDLLAVLLAACQAEKLIALEADRAVVAVEDLGERARARGADGTAYDTELLIAADGLWSSVRGAIVDDQPIGSAYVAYRGTLPIERMSSHAGLDNVVMWVGPDMHFVQYPVRRGELYNQVAVFRSPRYRPGHSDGRDDWGTVEEFDAHYAQTCDYVQGCARLMARDKRWPMYDRAPIAAWVRNRIVLMGDAAHPMLQYAAQGACQAIEDALCLADRIAATPADLPRALASYQAARAPRTARVQRTARDIGDFFHLAGAAASARNATMRRRAETDYAPLDWLYGHKA
ncbi:MAG: FAD-dependent monooxygenase [Proteobacteria bacterium]|nr:FAD-dependent monooxygenase [Pseudomonadota bacterium]